MARKANTGNVKWRYTRRRPERTLLYQLVETHYPRFVDLLANQGRSLPDYVQREFQDFLRCGLLEHGFLRVRCSDCRAERLAAFSCKRRGFCSSCGACRMVESAALLVDEVPPHLTMRQWVLSFPFQLRFLFASRPQVMTHVLGTVYRAIETHLIQQAGCTRALAKTGAVTLIQRFGSALNVHFHMLFLDGVYVIDGERPVFRRLTPPRTQALEALVRTISQRVGVYLEREGLLVRDIENSYLQLEHPNDSAITDLLGHSITYRIAIGPQVGRKAFTLQTVPARVEEPDKPNLAKTAGFSLHAGVVAKAHQRRKLERLCRYIARPAVATDRLALTPQGYIRYTLKTPYRDGTTHIILEPLDFIARLAALVPKPRVNLTRFHGVFAPNHRLRRHVTPAGCRRQITEANTPAQHRAARPAPCLRRMAAGGGAVRGRACPCAAGTSLPRTGR